MLTWNQFKENWKLKTGGVDSLFILCFKCSLWKSHLALEIFSILHGWTLVRLVVVAAFKKLTKFFEIEIEELERIRNDKHDSLKFGWEVIVIRSIYIVVSVIITKSNQMKSNERY